MLWIHELRIGRLRMVTNRKHITDKLFTIVWNKENINVRNTMHDIFATFDWTSLQHCALFEYLKKSLLLQQLILVYQEQSWAYFALIWISNDTTRAITDQEQSQINFQLLKKSWHWFMDMPVFPLLTVHQLWKKKSLRC